MCVGALLTPRAATPSWPGVGVADSCGAVASLVACGECVSLRWTALCRHALCDGRGVFFGDVGETSWGWSGGAGYEVLCATVSRRSAQRLHRARRHHTLGKWGLMVADDGDGGEYDLRRGGRATACDTQRNDALLLEGLATTYSG